jgi:hypothetical protein
MIRKLLKFLHEVGAMGVMGAFAVCIVLLINAPSDSLIAYAAVMRQIALINRFILVPSLAAVLISGLLAIAATESYKNAAWAWIKALLGLSTFEGTLLTVGASARRAADLSSLALTGQGDAVELAQVIHTEWGGLWVLSALVVINIVLAVWRPRIYRSTPA